MTDFLSYQFFVGIILGGLIVLVIYPLFKKKNQTDSFKDNLDEMGKNIKSLQEDNLKYQGSMSEKLKFFTNSGENFEKIANEMKNTLVAGSSQKQGAWGEMVLEHILTKLQFTEGEEFEKHKNFKSEEGDKLIPDFIVHFPGKRDVIIDSKVNLTAWDEYVNSDNKEDREEALKMRGYVLYSLTEEKVDEYLEDDEYIVSDLVGLNVFLDESCSDQSSGGSFEDMFVGNIRGVVLGSEMCAVPGLGQDLLEIALPSSHGGQSENLVLVPFVPEIVCNVDLDGKMVMITPPNGLLDLSYRREEKVRIKGLLPASIMKR